MSANVSDVLVQVNFKTPRGTLLNVYGKDEASLDMGLAILEDRVNKLIELEALLAGASNAAPLVNVAAPPAPGLPTALADNPWPAAAPSFTAAAAAAPNCAHGPRVGRSGTGAKGPWKAWFCNTPKGAPDQCDAIFLNRNTPDWNAHTA